MKFHRIAAVIERHAYEARRNVDRLTDLLYWPVLDIIVWGFFTIYLARGNRLQPGVVSFLLGAAILWGMFFAFQRDMAVGFLDELWSRNLINLFSTPLTVWEYMTGLIMVNVIKVALGMTAASLIAWAAYSFDIFPLLPRFLPFIANLVVFALALGIIITGFIFRFTTKIQALAWSFAALLQPVSCVFYPMSALPPWLRAIAWMLPTAHSFEGMRAILAGQGFSAVHFWWGVGLNVVYFMMAVGGFLWIFEKARNRGLLVKQD
ncbi:MAG TPA: ABC transporter permease [Candidatus Acidoferrales bacterium]|nr:ABC transporter permease [Candidatus Acidoferrales bacterium]